MKFGGTSVASLDKIKSAAKSVALEVSTGHSVIVIVSAMAGKTNELVDWVNETSPLYDAREYDAIVSSGENVTAGLWPLLCSRWIFQPAVGKGGKCQLEHLRHTLQPGLKKYLLKI